MLFQRKSAEELDFLVFGLGNPGPKYAATRHNAGWWVLDELLRRHKPFKTVSLNQSQAAYARIQPGPLDDAKRVALIKPVTYMNLSGQSIRAWVKGQAGTPFIVVYDDCSMALGKLRLRRKGSAGGHNGVKSIIASLGGQEFDRLKLGVGEPPGQMDSADYVLQEPGKAERLELDLAVVRAADVLEGLIGGMDWEAALRMIGDPGPSGSQDG
ncbi:aminoacyl-tRNA hydrolase [bacterium]|nr:aminoacyl-tRNA hydrolase [bacterium]